MSIVRQLKGLQVSEIKLQNFPSANLKPANKRWPRLCAATNVQLLSSPQNFGTPIALMNGVKVNIGVQFGWAAA
jgi:hypothetical protein